MVPITTSIFWDVIKRLVNSAIQTAFISRFRFSAVADKRQSPIIFEGFFSGFIQLMFAFLKRKCSFCPYLSNPHHLQIIAVPTFWHSYCLLGGQPSMLLFKFDNWREIKPFIYTSFSSSSWIFSTNHCVLSFPSPVLHIHSPDCRAISA